MLVGSFVLGCRNDEGDDDGKADGYNEGDCDGLYVVRNNDGETEGLLAWSNEETGVGYTDGNTEGKDEGKAMVSLTLVAAHAPSANCALAADETQTTTSPSFLQLAWQISLEFTR